MNKLRWIVGTALLLITLGAMAGCFLFDRPPVASFVVVYNVTDDLLVVDLDASSSSDPDDDEIAAYMWTFGDDVNIITPLDHTKLVTVPVLRVRYPTEGPYEITLFVRDDTGKTSEEGMTQTIVLPNLPMTPNP